MAKKKIDVRKHPRKLESGKITNVKKHTREIDNVSLSKHDIKKVKTGKSKDLTDNIKQLEKNAKNPEIIPGYIEEIKDGKKIIKIHHQPYIKNIDKRSDIMFHGTPNENLDNIKKYGLLVNPPKTYKYKHGWNTDKQISLSNLYDNAFYYASLFTESEYISEDNWRYEPLTVLIIKTDDLDLKSGVVQHSELVTNQNILKENIIGAFDSKGNIVNLKDINIKKNNFRNELLSKRNKEFAELRFKI